MILLIEMMNLKDFKGKSILMIDILAQMRKDHLFKECLKKLRMVKSMR